MIQVDPRAIIAKSASLIRLDGPYKSLDVSPYLNVCAALGLYKGDGKTPDCADVLRTIIRLAVLAERGQ